MNIMSNRLSPDQLARLQEARLRQQQARERIELLATNSIMAWLTQKLFPVVRDAVRGVVAWIINLFK